MKSNAFAIKETPKQSPSWHQGLVLSQKIARYRKANARFKGPKIKVVYIFVFSRPLPSLLHSMAKFGEVAALGDVALLTRPEIKDVAPGFGNIRGRVHCLHVS